jgi:hypothetical protein
VTVEGVLTTTLGAFDGGRGAFIQDGSGGIGLYFDSAVDPQLPAATRIRVTGTLDQRYSQLVIRVTRASIVDLGGDALPASVVIRTGDATESFEGTRITVEGEVVGSASSVADGVSVVVDDGSGEVRVILSSSPMGLASGVRLHVTGPLGQRDSSGTGTSGYRIYALDSADVSILAPPSPSPSPSPSPTPTASPSPTASASASPSPSASPSTSPTPSASGSPSPSPSSSALPVSAIADARPAAIGSRVHVVGVVTAETGRVGASLVAIEDSSGGMAVHLPGGAAAPARGTVLDVIGELAAPYGQLEIRPAAATLRAMGTADLPTPAVLVGALDESTEGLLVTVEGTVVAAPTASSGGDMALDVDLASAARVHVVADASAGIASASLHRGYRYRLTGVVGQRATALGRPDGYRLWLRDSADVVELAAPSPSPSASGSPRTSGSASPRPTVTPRPSTSPSPSPSAPAVTTIAAAILAGGTVTVEGIVTAGSGLLDSSGRVIVIQDSSAAVSVRLPAGVTFKAGRSVRITGTAGRSYGAPRILATADADLGAATVPAPIVLTAAPTAAQEWRLVRLAGVVRSIHRSGGEWKADVAVGAALFLVDALATAHVAPDRIVVGATVQVTGIARRPYPTATDRRFSVLPRSAADVTVTHPPAADTSGGSSSTATATRKPAGTGSSTATRTSTGTTATRTAGAGAGATASASPGTPLDVDLVDLPQSAGLRVRVGGLIAAVDATGISLDDGTATATVGFEGTARTMLAGMRVGLAVNLVGTATKGTPPTLKVTTADDVIPVADPAASDAAASPQPSSLDSQSPDISPTDAFGLSGATDPSADPADDASAAAGSGPGPTTLLALLLLSLAAAGAAAMVLGRGRRSPLLTAHPVSPTATRR